MDESNPKTIVISSLYHPGKEQLSILTLKAKILTLATKEIDVAMIDIDGYHMVYKLN